MHLHDIREELLGHVAPSQTHVSGVIDFLNDWRSDDPLLIHCWAGVSRSTAAAFVTACALNEGRAEDEIAATIRAASPTATPNPRFVAIADERLGRSGRMIDAIRAIGRGEDCFEGVPFALRL